MWHDRRDLTKKEIGPMQDFEIFELPVGGGTLALSPLPGRGGDVAGDTVVLRAWAPSVVVTMVEASEMAGNGAQALGEMLGDAQWLHIPVPDFKTLSPEQERNWSGIQADLLRCLCTGGRVLVHCMGGCGRSGMVVLRLMIAAGEPPDGALARLRELRPCAIETEPQMTWATSM